MTGMLTADELRPHLAADLVVIKEALAAIYAGEARKLRIDAIAVQSGLTGKDIATLLVESLEQHGTIGDFVAFLQGRGVAIMTFTDAPAGLTQGPEDGAFDEFDMADFLIRSHAFRCRIKVDGEVKGSGALVSPRLVLTAAHVIREPRDPDLPDVDPAVAPRLEVVASNSKSYRAREVFCRPCHHAEPTGYIPTQDEAPDHLDVALLRLDKPLGHMCNHITLPENPKEWTGRAHFFLVHFPKGAERGVAPGLIERTDVSMSRVVHNAIADQGSSGGPGFNNRLEFLGIHQGRLGEFRRIVPYDHIAQNREFWDELDRDKPPRYLWSLDGTLDSHVVIGRGMFFDAITAMVEGHTEMLRGIWVRRMDPTVPTGLSFSHDLLDQFLRVSNAAYRIVRVPMDLGVTDLVTHIHQIADVGTAPAAAQGVADGQTTDVAKDDDRMRRLVDQLDKAAAATNQTIWVYIDNPPAGLLAETQVQLEHFVQAAMTRPHLRLVIAGYETFGLVNALTTEVADAGRMAQPNLIVEELKNVELADVELTIAQMALALGLEMASAVVTDIAELSVKGVPRSVGHFFDPQHFGQISNVIRQEVRRRV